MGVPHFNAPLGVLPCVYPDKLYFSRNWKDYCPTRCWKPHDLDTIPARGGRIDGRSDRQK